MPKGKQTKAIKELAKTECFKPMDIQVLKEQKLTEVVAEDNREYLVFKSHKDAVEHAKRVFIEHFDDPSDLEDLKWTGTTIEEFAEEKIEQDGVQKYLSYDSHHKVVLTTGVAYRIF